jgi:two-component system OmpR family sensor kinase
MYQVNLRDHTNALFMKNPIITQIYRLHLQRQTSQTIFEANLAVYDLSVEHDEMQKQKILSDAKVLKREGFQAVNEALFFDRLHVYQQKIVKDMRSTMLSYEGDIYFYLESSKIRILIKDKVLKPYNNINLISAYITITSIVSLLFILILQRLRPLRKLRRKIAAFGAGEMDVSFALDGLDEIAMIGNELEHTQEKIHALIESRTLFLRNIMHELKTPIAKGRIASTMIKEEKHQRRLETIFLRLEELISEFALIEEVTAGFGQVEKKEYRLIDLIDGAVDMAMVDYDSVWVEIDAAYKIKVDYRIFVTAIKNMIDNAMKYSPNHQVKITVEHHEIIFENAGEQLKQPLSYYIEPFTKEKPAKDSFGLGLYLVDAILKSHGMVLGYEHEDGINKFIFVPMQKLEHHRLLVSH